MNNISRKYIKHLISSKGNKLIMTFFNQPRWKYVFISIYVVFFLFLFYVTIFLKWPLRGPNSDIFHHLACINELQKDFRSINDPFFTTGPKDPHYGPYLVMIAKIAQVLNLDAVSTYMSFGLINFWLLIISTYSFSKAFTNLQKKKENVAYLFPIIILMSSSIKKYIMAGEFSLSALIYTLSYPSTFSFALMMLNLSLMKKYLKNSLLNLLLYIGILFISWLIFLSSIIIGIVFFLATIILVLSDSISNKNIKIVDIVVLIVPFVTFLLSSIWPYYSVINVFFRSGIPLFISNISSSYTISDWLNFFGPILPLGLLFLFKHKNIYSRLWFCIFSLICISYIFPRTIGSYYRFLPYLIVPLCLSVSEELSKGGTNKYLKLSILCVFIIMGSISLRTSMSIVMNYNLDTPITTSEFYFMDILPRNSTVLSDPLTSYHVAGLMGFNAVSVHLSHSNPANGKDSSIRFNLTLCFFKNIMSDDERNSFFHTYQPNYLLIKKEGGWNWKALFNSCGDEAKILYENEKFILIKIEYFE